MWEKLKEEIKELYENNEEDSDIALVAKYLLNLMAGRGDKCEN